MVIVQYKHFESVNAALSHKERIKAKMKLKRPLAAVAAAVIALTCGCSVRPSSDAAWPTGQVEDKKSLTISIDDFNKEYNYWLMVNSIQDDAAEEVASKCAEKRSSIINYLINEKIVLQQAAKLGADSITEEQQTSIESSYNEFIEQSIENFKSYVNAGETQEAMSDAAILEEAGRIFDEKLTECGMDRDDILMWYRNAQIVDNLKAKLAEGQTIEYSDAEAEYGEITAGIAELYGNDPSEYEADLYYKYYWLPENARMIKHILIKIDSSDSTEIRSCRENGDDDGADRLLAQSLEKIRPRADEVLNMLENGGDFDEIAAEYSEDPGLESNPDGYLVVPGGSTYYEGFQNGAFELENVGDYKLISTDLGWHVIKYSSDAVITENEKNALIDAIYKNMQENLQTTAYNEAMQKWREEYAYDMDCIKLRIDDPNDTAEAADSSAAS